MKKTFPFHIENKHPDRLLDHTKHEIKKYMRRETRRPLPSGFDYWDFDCKIGPDQSSIERVHPKEINAAINTIKSQGHTSFFIELLVKAQKRMPRVTPSEDMSTQASTPEELLQSHLS
jgi:hypothetical protein